MTVAIHISDCDRIVAIAGQKLLRKIVTIAGRSAKKLGRGSVTTGNVIDALGRIGPEFAGVAEA